MVGCSGEQPTGQSTPTSGSQATEQSPATGSGEQTTGQSTPTSGSQATEQSPATGGDGQPTGQSTPTSGSQATEQSPATGGDGQPTGQSTPTSGSQATEQSPATGGDGQPTGQSTPTSGSQATEQSPATGGDGQPTGQSMDSESDHIEYMVKLLALDLVYDFWFLDLASISADPELALLSQNLTDTWNGWNQDSSDEFGLTLQDAAFAVSLPGKAVFLGGIEDVEGLRETVAGLGYQEQESNGVVYWVEPSQEGEKWDSFTILPNGVVMIMEGDPDYFLEGQQGIFIKYGSSYWDEDRDWQRYLNSLDSELDIGLIDDVVSDIRNSLMVHFEYGQDTQSAWTKAGAGTVRLKIITGFPDDDSAKLAETEARENLSELRAEAERAETEEQQAMAEDLSACPVLEADRSGRELTFTLVCRTDYFDFRFANYLLSVR